MVYPCIANKWMINKAYGKSGTKINKNKVRFKVIPATVNEVIKVANWDNSRWSATMTHTAHALHSELHFPASSFHFSFQWLKRYRNSVAEAAQQTACQCCLPPPLSLFLSPLPHKWSNYYCHVIVGKWSASLPACLPYTDYQLYTYICICICICICRVCR